MIITRIELENFRSYGEAEITPPTSGLTLVQGSNGAGKSSLISAAVMWCLFGDSPDGVSVKELRRQGSPDGEPTSVSVTINADGREIMVYRALKGKNLTTIAEVTVDGTPMTDVKSGAATAFVEGLLKVDATGFKTAYMVQQKSLDSLVKQTAASRKKTIEKLSGIEKLASAVDSARADARAAQKYSASFDSDGDGISDLQDKVAEASQLLVDALTDHSEASGRHERRSAALKDVQAELRETESAARSAIKQNAEHSNLEAQLSNLQARAEKGKEILADAQKKLDTAQKNSSEMHDLWEWPDSPIGTTDLSDDNQKIGALRAERTNLMASLEELEKDGADSCPTCGQKADVEHIRSETQEKLDLVVKEGKALAAKIEEATSKNEIAAKILSADKALRSEEHEVKRTQETLDSVMDEISKVESQLSESSLVEYDEETLKALADKEKELSSEADQAAKIASEEQSRVSAAERDLATAEAQLSSALENEDKRKAAINEYETSAALAGALERFRAQRLASLAPSLSESASEYLVTLTEGSLTQITLTDDFEPMVTAANGSTRPVAMLSGGEESLVALSLRLAIGDEVISGEGSLLVLDEILGALDEERRTLVTKTLRDLGRQVFLVHHGDTEFADEVYTVTPGPNGATVQAG
jgi:DNA repair exonuclease SbcCD ATPase subunit